MMLFCNLFFRTTLVSQGVELRYYIKNKILINNIICLANTKYNGSSRKKVQIPSVSLFDPSYVYLGEFYFCV